MSKTDSLDYIKSKAMAYKLARDQADERYDDFLLALLNVFDKAPKRDRLTQKEIAAAIDTPPYTRGRIAQLLVKARQL